MKKRIRSRSVIGLSFLIAILLTIIPLPAWAAWCRPLWVLMAVSYWALALELRVSVGIAWLLGLLMDVLLGTLLAEHALALCLCVYLVGKLRIQIRNFPLWQQSAVIAILSLIYQFIIFIIQGIVGHEPTTILYWLPVLTSAIFWPWVFILMRDSRRRFVVS